MIFCMVYDVNMDRLLKLWNDLPKMHLAPLMLRLGLAFVFVYAAISSFVTPRDWVGFLPTMMTDFIDADLLLKFFSTFELLLAAWLLSGVYVRLAGLVSALMMVGIVVTNPSVFIVSFRDIGLAFAGLALVFTKENSTE